MKDIFNSLNSKSSTKNALIVLSGRDIPFISRRIESLPIDQFWIKGNSEREAAPFVNNFIDSTGYDNYFISSDDNYISKVNFLKLEEALKTHDIVSSYCAPYQDKNHLSFSTSPYMPQRVKGCLFPPSEPSFLFQDILDFLRSGQEYTNCTFNGSFFCGARRRIWLEIPFSWRLGGSDESWAERALSLGYEMKIVKSAPCVHFCSFKARLKNGFSFFSKLRDSASLTFRSWNNIGIP